MRIILTDDEQGALELLKEEVENVLPNAEIEGFRFPEDALRYAADHPVDVAFLDVEMPQMSGLELARRLKTLHSRINIVFVTAYDDYAMDAMKLRASGYLLKPVDRKSVEEELEALRYSPETTEKGIYIRTFGQFDVMVDGKIITFHRMKAKEMLAYLVDQRGGSVTKKELASALFEDREYDRSLQDYLNKIIRDLELTLGKAHIGEILNLRRNSYSVNPDTFSCDLYEYELGLPRAINAFHGIYMRQYAWGEETLGTLF